MWRICLDILVFAACRPEFLAPCSLVLSFVLFGGGLPVGMLRHVVSWVLGHLQVRHPIRLQMFGLSSTYTFSRPTRAPILSRTIWNILAWPQIEGRSRGVQTSATSDPTSRTHAKNPNQSLPRPTPLSLFPCLTLRPLPNPPRSPL